MLNSAIKLDTPSEWWKYETKMAETNITGKLLHGSIMPKRQGIQHRKAPVTPGLRPGYDLSATEKLVNRRKNVRLVAEVVRLVAEVAGDRKGQISRRKIMVMFKTQSHRAYDHVTTYLRSKNVAIVHGQIEERTYDWPQRSYDWSQRSWVIARGKSVATRSMVIDYKFKGGFFRHERRIATKFGTHVRIETRLALT